MSRQAAQRSSTHACAGRSISLAKLERAEQAGHDKIKRRATRGREGLERAAPYSPKIESARQRIDDWEQGHHDRLTRQVEKAREKVTRAEQKVRDKLDPKN